MSAPDSSTPVRRSQEPAAAPGARAVAIVVAIALVALGIAAGRELILRHFETSWKSWADPFTQWVGTLTFQQWMLYVAVLAIIGGVVLLVYVFKPRAKTHRRLVDPAGNIWMRPVDIARMTTAAARTVPGVQDARTTVKPSQVLVDVIGDTTDTTLTSRIARTLAPLVAQVDGNPELLVKISADEEAQS